MSEVNFDDFKCRCSSINKMLAASRSNPILTEKQALRLDELESKSELTEKMKIELAELLVKKDNGTKIILSDSCIAYLMDEYAWITRGMIRLTKELMDIPQMQKGNLVEAESIILLSIVDGVIYKPNMNDAGEKERVSNKFLTGEIDAYEGKQIMGANIIPDVKSVWDYPTFLCKIHEPLSADNDWQVKGYCNITGAQQGFIADCLIDTPEEVMNGLKWKLLNKLHVATEEAPEFKERWKLVEHSTRFNHIPPTQRVNKKKVELMTAFQEQQVYDRVKVCREWLCNFHETYQGLQAVEVRNK